MTEYLTGYVTENAAMARSQQEAWSRGCQNKPEDLTAYWQPWIAHPVEVEFALVFSDEESKSLLSAAELAALNTDAQMEDDDWFIEV